MTLPRQESGPLLYSSLWIWFARVPVRKSAMHPRVIEKVRGFQISRVPLWPKTAKVLHQWRKCQPGSSRSTIFPSLRGNVLTRDSVNHLLRKIVQLAIPACPSLATKRVTPHLIRHGTAMHLLQSGVDITVIALWLGHEDVQTTHVYLQADLAMKEKALNKLAPPETKVARFKPCDEVLAFLASL